MKNLDFRLACRGYGITSNQLSHATGIHEQILEKWLQSELTAPRRKRLDDAVDAILAQRQAQKVAQAAKLEQSNVERGQTWTPSAK